MMLEKIKNTDFDKLFELMENSFPSDEYRNYDEQKNLLSNPLYNVYVIYDGDFIKAFIALWDFERFAYIEHFAVNPKYRNCGLGSDVLSKIKNTFDKRICLEVELPTGEMPKRRINFYKRNGFYLNEYDYVQPPMDEDKNPVPLMIMTTNSKLNIEEFEHIRNTLYSKVYKK